jgi:hypothetical protein
VLERNSLEPSIRDGFRKIVTVLAKPRTRIDG